MFSHLSLITSNTRPLVTKFWEQKAAEMSAQVCVQVFECLTTCVCALSRRYTCFYMYQYDVTRLTCL